MEFIGILISFGYLGSYFFNVDCIWVIMVLCGYYIELKFKIFDIYKVGRGCWYDYVEVCDGNLRNLLLLGRYCG